MYNKRGKRGKAFFGSIIAKALSAVRGHGWNRTSRLEINEFEKGANALLDRLTTLEDCQQKDVIYHMKRVLRAAHRLDKTKDFDNIFSDLTTRELEPTMKTSVVARLSKLAQYRKSSQYLLRTAKEFDLFKNAEVTCVSLDPHLFSRSLTIPTECCLANSLSRCKTGAQIEFLHKNIYAKLKTNDSQFRSTVQKLLSESRVHAEVQIVCYYELQPAGRKPRVICSSKDACYLCNLFIQLHGTFHIPKTHGNLWPGWCLLPVPALSHVLAQLNIALESQIREILLNVMADPMSRLMLSPNENESTVFPFSTSLPTLASSAMLVEAQEVSNVEQRPQEVKHAPAPEPLAGSPSQFPVTEPSDSVFTTLEVHTVDMPTGRQTQSTTPELPASESLKKTEGPPSLTSGTHGELAEEIRSPDEKPVEQTAALSEPHIPTNNHDGNTNLKSEPELEQDPEPDLEPNSVPPAPTPTPETLSVLDSGSNLDPTPVERPPQMLTRGQVLSLRIDNAKIIPSFTTGLITIFLDSILKPGISTSSPLIEVRIQWLPRRRAAAFRVARPRGYIRLDSLKGGVDIDSGSAECVYLANGEDVVMMEVVRGGV
jgi:hypothetical protein